MTYTTPATAVPFAIVQTQHRNILRDNDNYFNALVPPPTAANQVPILESSIAGVQGSLTAASIRAGVLSGSICVNGAISSSHIGSLQIGLEHLAGTVVLGLLPAGVIMMYPSTSIPAGWTRETAVNGRLILAAGSLWAEDSDYGTSWSHNHHVGFDSSIGDPNLVPNINNVPEVAHTVYDHFHTINQNVSNATWEIPTRASVFIRKDA